MFHNTVLLSLIGMLFLDRRPMPERGRFYQNIVSYLREKVKELSGMPYKTNRKA
jgi:hypothetical protein